MTSAPPQLRQLLDMEGRCKKSWGALIREDLTWLQKFYDLNEDRTLSARELLLQAATDPARWKNICRTAARNFKTWQADQHRL
eukprot:7340325-Pyramimonas_sp.AAC.1